MTRDQRLTRNRWRRLAAELFDLANDTEIDFNATTARIVRLCEREVAALGGDGSSARGHRKSTTTGTAAEPSREN